MRTGGVYKITCKPNGRIYIGSTLDFNKRWREHMRHLDAGRHRSRHLHRAWVKYGRDAFAFEVLAVEDDREKREALEQFFLDCLQPFGKRGFNSCRFVGTTKGVKLSDEHRRAISLAGIGRRHRPESIQKMREARLRYNPQIGRPLTDKQKAVLHRSGENHPWFGRHHSEETRAKLKKAQGVPVLQVSPEGEVIKAWESAADAARFFGLKGTETIYRSADSGWKMAAGFHWRRQSDRSAMS